MHAFGNHLDLSIKTFLLRENPAYTAVSYTWDGVKNADGQGDLRLTINGRVFPVQQNLRSFLERFDHSQWKMNRPANCWVWIDALCIDQNSTTEKNAQVALMGRIFQNAACVFAWLGHQAPERLGTTTSLEDLVVELSGRRNTRSKVNLFAAQFGTPSLSWAQVCFKDTRNPDLREWRQHMWERFEMICERNFWRRVWIRQELWLAADVIICHGKDSIAWADFEAVFMNLISQMQNHKNHHHVYYPAWKLSREVTSEVVQRRLLLRKSLAQGQIFSGLAPLRSLIEACRGLRSTLSHDYVYGLVGLATDGGQLPIDYSKSTEEVYLDTLAVTQHTEDLVPWNRMLVGHLGLRFDFKNIAKAVASRAEQGGRWHVLCRGTSRSFILDASHSWEDSVISHDETTWTRRAMFNPRSWIDAWDRHHGSENPVRKVRGLNQEGFGLDHSNASMEMLFAAYATGLQWKVQSNFAIYKDENMNSASSDCNSQEVPPALQRAMMKAPTSSMDHLDDYEARASRRNNPRLILGSLGEIGIASETAKVGDLILGISNSSLPNSRPSIFSRGPPGNFSLS